MTQETSGAPAPAADTAVDTPAVEPVEQASESTAEETTEQGQPEADKDEGKQPPKWAQKRINELTRDKYRERAQREHLERRLAEIEQRLQPPAGEAGEQAHAQEQPRINEQEVFRQAEQSVAFNMKCNTAFDAGSKAFPDFEDALGNLRMVGLDKDALSVIVEAEEPHKVLHHLGKNPDEAERILSLSPVAMARQIGALEARLAAKPATPKASSAPAPIAPINPRSGGSGGIGDDVDMKTWTERRNAQLAAQRQGTRK